MSTPRGKLHATPQKAWERQKKDTEDEKIRAHAQNEQNVTSQGWVNYKGQTHTNVPLKQVVHILEHERVGVKEDTLVVLREVEHVQLRKRHTKLRALQQGKMDRVATMKLFNEKHVVEDVDKLVSVHYVVWACPFTASPLTTRQSQCRQDGISCAHDEESARERARQSHSRCS